MGYNLRQRGAADQWGAVGFPTPAANDAGMRGKSHDFFSSEMHQEVSSCLSHVAVVHENGVPSGPFLLDIITTDKARRVIFEINAPQHYYEGSDRLLAQRRFRQRLLKYSGHHLHMVNAPAWTSLTKSEKVKLLFQDE